MLVTSGDIVVECVALAALGCGLLVGFASLHRGIDVRLMCVLCTIAAVGLAISSYMLHQWIAGVGFTAFIMPFMWMALRES